MVKIKIGEIEYEETKANKLGEGGFGAVFRGRCCCSDHGDIIAVKKVKVDHLSMELMEDELEKLKHDNIVRLFHIKKQDDFRYYALEYCEGSMEDLFEKPSEPFIIPEELKPEKKDVLIQLAKGLEHIHSKNMVHRDIKPSNVLIRLGGKLATFKWADFGLCKSVSEDRKTYTLSSKVRGTLFWIAPEVMEKLDDDIKTKGSTKSDIWVAGCLFFYYLTNGKHPFGEAKVFNMEMTVKNIKDGNPVKINELKFEHFHNVILNMIDSEPSKRQSATEIIQNLEEEKNEKQIELIASDTSGLLRRGKKISNVVDVFRGKYKNSTADVAVKRVRLDLAEAEGDFSHLSHENVVKLLYAESDDQFRYFALELCVATMDQLFEKDGAGIYSGLRKGSLSTEPAPEYVLPQLARGLAYIHDRNLIYGNVKPENVLFFETEAKQSVIVKWADFGLVKKDKLSITSYDAFASNNNKIIAWRAPEWLNDSATGAVHPTVESDIWLTGRLFYYFFDDGPRWMKNASDFYNIDLEGLPFKSSFAKPVIRKMMARDPQTRINLSKAIDEMEKRIKTIVPLETEVLKLCSKIQPTEADVNRLCELFANEEIHLNCTNEIGYTPFLILCNSIDMGREGDSPHCRSLRTLAEQMKRCRMAPVLPREITFEKTTPLHVICSNCYNRGDMDEIVVIFIELGVDPTAKDPLGLTALDRLCNRLLIPTISKTF